jgi:SAM-dependent methyltransferase
VARDRVLHSGAVSDKLELLSVSLLDERREEVERLRRLAKGLALGLGWHYLLDLPWVLRELGGASGLRILDAGAGLGLLQWRLAEEGAHVLSVDRGGRELLPLQYRLRFVTRGQRPRDLRPFGIALAATLLRPARLARTLRALASGGAARCRAGVVVLYGQDLRHLADVDTGSIDAVVSISALEHNEPSDLACIVAELMRVLKPGGVLLATLGASAGEDWYHEPSSGWCYGEASLRRLFDLGPEVVSNFARYDELLEAMRACPELRDGLDRMYFRSGRNGMPWGVWDPRYLSVGVRKVKRAV